jgi:hypothetical protein
VGNVQETNRDVRRSTPSRAERSRRRLDVIEEQVEEKSSLGAYSSPCPPTTICQHLDSVEPCFIMYHVPDDILAMISTCWNRANVFASLMTTCARPFCACISKNVTAWWTFALMQRSLCNASDREGCWIDCGAFHEARRMCMIDRTTRRTAIRSLHR